MQVFHNQWDMNDIKSNHGTNPQEADLVIYFANRHIMEDRDHFDKLRHSFPTACIMGCSTGGEIYGDNVQNNSLVFTALRFNKTLLKHSFASVTGKEEDSFAAGKKIGQDLADADLAAIFVLSEGLHVNGSAVVQGIRSQISPHVPITGGLAGDGTDFQRTLITANDYPREDIITAVGFYGQHIRIGHGSCGGWDPFGPERVITKAEGNIVYELDSQPALDLYKLYLGDEANNLPSSALLFPLAIRHPDNPNESIVRTILNINEEDKSLIFAGSMPVNYVAQLMRGNFHHLVEGAASAAAAANLQEQGTNQQLAILISCIGRKLLLGQRIWEEIEAAGKVLGDHCQTIGFYSYGEISPHAASGLCELHNQTMTITTFAEQ
jgi:hypothetical protein